MGLTTALRSPLTQRDPSETLGDANLESQLRSTSPGVPLVTYLFRVTYGDLVGIKPSVIFYTDFTGIQWNIDEL